MASINISYLFISLIAGFLTFFAGCLAPIAPVYVAFLAAGAGEKSKKKKIFLFNSLLFTIGFIFVFLLFGFGVNLLSVQLAFYRFYFQKILGFLIIFLGLFLLDIAHFNFFTRQFVKKSQAGTKIGAFLLGISLSIAWTPCIGPVLATILLWVSTSTTFYVASIYLILFSIGLTLPFVLIGIGFEYFYPKIRFINKYSKKIKHAAAILLILIGLLMVSGYYAQVNSYLLKKLGTGAFLIEF